MDTHVYFLLDRSGSMQDIKADVIGGFNAYVDSQKGGPNLCRFTVAQFDTPGGAARWHELHTNRAQGAPLLDVVLKHADIDGQFFEFKLNETNFVPRGGTALLDATWDLLDLAEQRADKRRRSGKQPEAVVVVTYTDGEENSSDRTTLAQLRARIETLTAKRAWTFTYLGANQDAYTVGASMGYYSTKSYAASSAGVYGSTQLLSNNTTGARGMHANNVSTATMDFFDLAADQDDDDDEATA